jgi:hypothetical protein
MPKIIRVNEKKPFVISSTKNGLVVGKYMTNYLLPNKSNVEKAFQETKKRTQQIAKEWKKIRTKKLEKSLEGLRILEKFYKQAAQYYESYWKLCAEKKRLGKEPSKMSKEMRKAEKEFEYFWRERELPHPKGCGF